MTRSTTKPLIDLSVFCKEGDREYHAQRGRYLSSHQLQDFRQAPIKLRRKQLGIAIGEQEPGFFTFGRAAHVLILEGMEAFQSRYLVSGGPVNPKTGNPYGTTTKKYREWKQNIRQEVISLSDGLVLSNMALAVRENTEAAELLTEGDCELVLRQDYQGVPCQIRADWINPYRGLVDLKTVMNIDRFEDDARRYEYAHQFSFYREVITARTGARIPVWIVAVEKNEPFRCGVWRVSEGALGAAQEVNERAIADYRECLETGVWPTGYEAIRELNWI